MAKAETASLQLESEKEKQKQGEMGNKGVRKE